MKNVNQKPGPRVGNAGNMVKRNDFQAGKAERSAVADIINRALENKKVDDAVNPKLEGVAPVVKPRKFRR